jgi:hypothetical protein
VLYKTVQAPLEAFLSELESAAEPPVLPAFAIAEVEAFLRCGISASDSGPILAKCRDCGWCCPVDFSCKRRGLCASCVGRTMCDFASGLVDRVIPPVPVRQRVLTVPHSLRAKLAFDPGLTSVVLRNSSGPSRRGSAGGRGGSAFAAPSSQSQAGAPSYLRAHRRGRGTRRGHGLPPGRTCARRSRARAPRRHASSRARPSWPRSPRRRPGASSRPACAGATGSSAFATHRPTSTRW